MSGGPAPPCDHGRMKGSRRLGLGAVAAAVILAPGMAPTPSDAPAAPVTQTATRAVLRPPIQQRLIPFGATRRRQMAHYSQLHYGTASWRLHPRGIVEHYTATRSLRSVFATFRSNAPDPELGQLPGVCAHFVVDRDGTIYQVVPLWVRCRHTVGLNHRTIGIEHVGLSDEDVMGNRRQRVASIRLSAWLADRFDIASGDVIGHHESLHSRFRHELYAPWRCQTHGDFRRVTMDRYRALLNAQLAGTDADTGPPDWRPSSC